MCRGDIPQSHYDDVSYSVFLHPPSRRMLKMAVQQGRSE